MTELFFVGESIKRFLKRQPAARLIMLGFILVILVGTILLLLPISIKEGSRITFIDALFTATSATCVTGLVVVDIADTFTLFGRSVVAPLIQIGGLGVASIGACLFLIADFKIGLKGRMLIKEALNIRNTKEIAVMIRKILMITFGVEMVGAILSFLLFIQNYRPVKALEMAVFHSIASFNNAGFDIMGDFRGLEAYRYNYLMNLLTMTLIILGGIGYIVILDIYEKKNPYRWSLHSKIVILTSGLLILTGTILLKYTEKLTWLEAGFFSVSARTAGFSTSSVGEFSNAGLFLLSVLMFIGASPGSTGGGIKTTTFFVILCASKNVIVGRDCIAFNRKLSGETIKKALAIFFTAFSIVGIGVMVLCMIEPERDFIRIYFEVISAFGTVGLSTGITPELSGYGKGVIMLLMFAGRLGVLTLVSIGTYRRKYSIVCTEESISIG